MEARALFQTDKIYVVLNGEIEIGAVVAGILYRYDQKGLPFQTYGIIGDNIIQHYQVIGKIEGLRITLEKTKEIFDLVEK